MVGENFDFYLPQMARNALICPPWLEKILISIFFKWLEMHYKLSIGEKYFSFIWNLDGWQLKMFKYIRVYFPKKKTLSIFFKYICPSSILKYIQVSVGHPDISENWYIWAFWDKLHTQCWYLPKKVGNSVFLLFVGVFKIITFFIYNSFLRGNNYFEKSVQNWPKISA